MQEAAKKEKEATTDPKIVEPIVVPPVVAKIHPDAVKLPVKKASINMDDELEYESLM